MRTTTLSASLLALCLLGYATLRGQDRQADDTAKPGEGFTLKTAETIEFTTDEVTWMQVDVSPDGGTILFDPARSTGGCCPAWTHSQKARSRGR